MNETNGTGANLGGNGFISHLDLPHVKIPLSVCYGVVLFMCIFGNSLVVLVVARDRNLRTTTHLFLTSLAVADLLVGLFCVLPALVLYIQPAWQIGRVMCKICMFMRLFSYVSSVGTLCVVSVERYCAIVNPLHCKILTIPSRRRMALATIWICAGIYSCPMLIIYDTVALDAQYTFCLITVSLDVTTYITITFAFLYATPVLMLTLLYMKIGYVLWISTKDEFYQNVSDHSDGEHIRMRSNMFQSPSCQSRCGHGKFNQTTKLDASPYTLAGSRGSDCLQVDLRPGTSACSAHTGSYLNTCSTVLRYGEVNIPSRGEPVHTKRIGVTKAVEPATEMCLRRRTIRSRRKVVRLLAVVVVIFAICVFPHHLRLMLEHWKDPGHTSYGDSSVFPQIAFIMLYLNSGINPILYAFLSGQFRRRMRAILFCRRKECGCRCRLPCGKASFEDRV